MKSIVVTGATSMIGVALISEAIRNSIKVLAIVRENSKKINRIPKSDLIQVIPCNIDKLKSISWTNEKYDVFYHFAWDYTKKEQRDAPILQEQNIKYTLDAVGLAKRLGCHKFIGAGSQAEYGHVDGVITPDTGIFPQTAYGMAKYAAGRLSQKLCIQYGMTHIWGRIFSVYGNYDNEGTMLVYAINQFMKKETARFSAATQMWDYLHETDAGKIFYLLGKSTGGSKTYCIASGKSRPLKEFIMELREAFGKDAVCEFAGDTTDGKLPGLQADTSELEKDIGFVPGISFKEGIEKLIRYRKYVRGGG